VPGESGGRVNDQVLDRVGTLISAERLPDRATIDFMIETLRTLQLAYPNDPRVPEALDALTLRLLDGARQSYDAGNPFQAGRLVELALTTGAARTAVEKTAADFATGRPPSRPAEPVSAPAGTPPENPPVDAGTDGAEAGPVIAELPAPAATGPAPGDLAEEQDDGLDALVDLATGVAMGALAVESVGEDPSAAPSAPIDSASSPTPSTEPPASPATPVDRLPRDFPLEDAGTVAASLEQRPPLPAFRPLEQLTVTHREPFRYPGGVLRGVRSVLLEFTVTETGEVRDLVANGDAPERFVQAASRAISSWRFEPAVGSDGRPTPVRTAIRVTFRG
jgi:hypothetical protein